MKPIKAWVVAHANGTEMCFCGDIRTVFPTRKAARRLFKPPVKVVRVEIRAVPAKPKRKVKA